MVRLAVDLGADVGLDPIIEQTADETPLDVGEKLLQGEQQLWSVTKAGQFIGTVVTQVEVRAYDEKVLVVKYMAGPTFKDWLGELNDALTAFGREVGATAIETHSREALRKQLLGLGWKKVAVLYRMAVDG